MTHSPYISGFGAFVPPKVVTNHDLASYVDTSDEWIVSRTGISERRVMESGVVNSDLALPAARSALARSGCPAEEITHILYASCTPDAACPPVSCTLEHKLGLSGLMALDLNAVCSGFVYGLEVARSLALMHPDARILLVASETLSLRCNWQDRATCVLFGDGAGAAVISSRAPGNASVPAAAIQDVLVSSDGALGDLLEITGGYSGQPYTLGATVGPEYFVRMQGREVFKHAVRSMAAVCRELLERNGLTPADIDVLVPHQANLRIIEAVGSRLGVSEDKVFVNVQKYGNTSAASIPLALAEALDSGFIRPGMTVLLTTFGGGFTWGATLLRF